MKLSTFVHKGKEFPGIISDDKEYVYALPYRDMNCLIGNFGKDIKDTVTEKIRLSEVKFKAPITIPLQDLICIGVNYAEHAKESAMFKRESYEESEYPVVFSKRANYIIGDGEGIENHFDINDSLDYESELAVIIGRDAKNVEKQDALDYVFGYTIVNDISSRNIQRRHKQWYMGKSLDGFTAMGPYILTKDEFDYKNKGVKSYVNGELRQNSNTSLMLFDIESIISELSKGLTLKTGTIISTGTPSGVGMGFNPPKFLKSGDIVTCEIEGLGKLTNTVL